MINTTFKLLVLGNAASFKTFIMKATHDLQALQSQTIDWLRFPLIICVIFIHNATLPADFDVTTIDWQSLSAGDLFIYMKILFSHVLTHIAVPIFFMISGFLFFLRTPKLTLNIYKNKIKKRLHTLLIPYLL